jgi:hypothetical protein
MAVPEPMVVGLVEPASPLVPALVATEPHRVVAVLARVPRRAVEAKQVERVLPVG